MFAKIALPASATGIGTLFGLPERMCQFRFSFPESNANNATIAKPTGIAAGALDVDGEPGATSLIATDNLNSVRVSGTITDYIVLEWYYI